MLRLVAENVALRYGTRALVRDLSFAAEAGEPLAITGANGSGKSSLLRVLAGVRGPDTGRVFLERGGRAEPPHRLPRQVGFVAPYLQHYDALSGAENLHFLAQSYGLGARAARARTAALLERVGLAGRGDDLLRTYSTGMRQRLRLAAALLHDPPVLLLDEPSATLDAAGRALVAALVADDRRVVVVATNEPDEAALCTRRVLLGGGVEAGTAAGDRTTGA
ncbi:MAG: ATP-binding cassette domain-containing protein [Rubricoccaceae bacterium]